MGQLDNRSEIGSAASKDAEDVLRSVAQDLQSLQQTVISQLAQDVKRLQTEKSQLLEDIEQLQQQQRSLLANQQTLSQRLPGQENGGQPIHPGNSTARSAATYTGTSTSPADVVRSPHRSNLSQFQLGLLMILLSTVALSLHNVVVGIIGSTSKIFDFYQVGGFIQLNLGNALLILWMRMLVVVPLMMTIARFLYPPAWRDIRAFLQLKDRRLLGSVVGSGFFLFLSQVMIYTAIGQVGPGVAVTILFMYPLVTVPLAWLLFRDRPTTIRVAIMIAILCGVVLTAFPKLSATSTISWLGIGTAVLSGVAFAFYLITMQISFRRLHPVPVSLIQFATIFVLTSLSLIVRPTGLGIDVLPEGRPGLIVGGVILGTLTLVGYLFNNFGVRFMGAAQASILASIGPVLTALLAFLIVPGPRTALQSIQWLGIMVVTIGVFGLAFERMFLQSKAAKPVG